MALTVSHVCTYIQYSNFFLYMYIYIALCILLCGISQVNNESITTHQSQCHVNESEQRFSRTSLSWMT